MRARRNGRKRHGEKLLPLIEDETAGFNGVVIRRSKEGGRGEEQMCVRKHGATAGEVSGRERRCSSTAEGEPAARACLLDARRSLLLVSVFIEGKGGRAERRRRGEETAAMNSVDGHQQREVTAALKLH